MAAEPGAATDIQKIDPQHQTSKGILMGYPLRLPVSIIERHQDVEAATKCQTTRSQEDTHWIYGERVRELNHGLNTAKKEYSRRPTSRIDVTSRL